MVRVVRVVRVARVCKDTFYFNYIMHLKNTSQKYDAEILVCPRVLSLSPGCKLAKQLSFASRCTGLS